MQAAGSTFGTRVTIAIHDERLQAALAHASGGFVDKRASQAGLYHLAMRIGISLLSRFGRRRGALSWLPLAGGWTDTRDLPAPQGRTFQQLWTARKGARP